MKDFTLNNCQSNPGVDGTRQNTLQQLPVTDWLADIPETRLETDLVEVQFKNTRKGYYLNSAKLPLEKGDIVAVESSPGHDIGRVTLIGRLVLSQIKKLNINLERYEVKRVYRKAKPVDLEKYEESKAKEHDTMIKARKIAADLNLNMKIGDVEYQGDGNKAIFYYIADGRVDFRQLIKVLADVFKVRIEMKQIGARQEAGRIGGIGPCGRELCCTTWMSSFVSVSTAAARTQDISTNPLKLAGQCAKIKCCINYELAAYTEAKQDIPDERIVLQTKESDFYHFKTDVFKRMMTYTSAPGMTSNLITISVDRVKEIIALNNQGIKVESLTDRSNTEEQITMDYENVVGQDSLTRFDQEKRQKNKRRNRNNNNNNSQNRSFNNQQQDNREFAADNNRNVEETQDTNNAVLQNEERRDHQQQNNRNQQRNHRPRLFNQEQQEFQPQEMEQLNQQQSQEFNNNQQHRHRDNNRRHQNRRSNRPPKDNRSNNA
ncbi:MAG: regulatory iron-sulfur-containing complex subunit RicT [Bacteroidales bacterium]|nr:regulatory iron-sulfur-containing complex subunit RicT [Bacteroidales bacterium]